MNKRYVISLNQFADFSKGTDASKRRIIRQQKSPNKFMVSWYQLPKARIKKSIENYCDLDPIIKGIEELKNRISSTSRQENNKTVSLQAFKRFVNIKLPNLLKDVPYNVIKKVESKSIFIN